MKIIFNFMLVATVLCKMRLKELRETKVVRKERKEEREREKREREREREISDFLYFLLSHIC